MKRTFLGTAALTACTLAAVSACSSPSAGTGSQTLPAAPAGISAAAAAPDRGVRASVLSVTPSSLELLQSGSGGALVATVKEKNYTGAFMQTSTCSGIATIAPSSGNGPSLPITLTGVKAGTCAVNFKDASGNKATLGVTVTTTTIALAGPLPGAATARVSITPGSVVPVALSNCASGCKFEVPAKPGSDAFAVSVVNAKNAQLAVGNPVTVAIASGKANNVSIPLLKVIASLAWGAIPDGAAGTAFPAAGKTVTLAAKDAGGNVIAGAYEHPIVLSDTDASSASALTVNGSAGSVTKSTDAVKLTYTGLAIVPATLRAVTPGVPAATATFKPAASTVSFTCGTLCKNAEIDLYSTTPATPGYNGGFTATQTGWTEAPYNKPLTYSFAAINGQTNNCPNAPSAGNRSYAVTPASGVAGTAFTVNATGNAVAGECAMTLAGGAGATTGVTLTFTSSSVGVGERRRTP